MCFCEPRQSHSYSQIISLCSAMVILLRHSAYSSECDYISCDKVLVSYTNRVRLTNKLLHTLRHSCCQFSLLSIFWSVRLAKIINWFTVTMTKL